MRDEDVQDPGHGPRDIGLGHRRAEAPAEPRALLGRAADRDLVPLLALLVDAEDADVPHVVVAAGVSCTRRS